MIDNLKLLWDNRDTVLMLGTAVAVYVVYLLPAFIAFYRHHPKRRALLWLNFWLGWTGFGWILVLRRALDRL